MPYLSSMLGTRIVSAGGESLGRLEDVVAVSGPKFPVVKGIMVTSGRGSGRRLVFMPWSDVIEWGQDRMVVAGVAVEQEPSPGDMLLARDLLDKQIVDMDGYKIVRVSDIRIARSGGELRVMGADVGFLAILRRLGLGAVASRLRGAGGVFADRLLPWNLVSPVEPMPYDVRLKVPYRKFMEIHPSDIADIIEQLDEDRRAKVLALVDDPKAAEVLAQVVPHVRPTVAGSIDDERLSDLLEIMPPDEAADILGELSREKAQVLLSLMGIEESRVVRMLLGYDPDTAGGRMTTEFVAIPQEFSAVRAIEHLRRIGEEAETVYYVYVVDADGHLSGVLSLRDLLRSPPGEPVGRLMMRDVITTEVDDDQEAAAEKLSRYNLLAIPVVDEDHVLKGIVTVDDAIDVMIEEGSEDLSRLSGVPMGESAPASPVLDSRRWAATAMTFLGGMLATSLFGIFRTTFVAALALVYFVPLALRASNDVSTWALAASVRGMGAGAPSWRLPGRALARESIFTLATAAAIAGAGLALGFIWSPDAQPAFAGAAGLFAGVTFAGMTGLLLPVLLAGFHADPAVLPGRVVGIIVMTVSTVVFLAVSGLLIGVL